MLAPPDDSAMSEPTRTTRPRIAANAPLALKALKRVVSQGLDMPLAHALEMDKYMFGLLRHTEDRIEGRKAFQEKRKPQYKGR